MSQTTAPSPRIRQNLTVLMLAQALLGSQMPMIFSIAGLAGQMLAPDPCWATLPISTMVFGSMTTAPWLSPLMQRHGRRAGFWAGTAAGAVGALVAAWALWIGSFWLFVAAGYLTGIYQSSQGFLRFAAADEGSPEFRAKAISRVLAAGLFGAVIGPQLAVLTSSALVVPFAASYLAIAALNIVGSGLFLFLNAPPPGATITDSAPPRPLREILSEPPIMVAMICGMVAYALMNLVMTSTPLAVMGCGFVQRDVSNIITAHVLAMFLPSFFTGHLIARFGAERIVAIGIALLAVAGGVAIAGVELANFYAALVLLGLGWNFGFIGATAMLTRANRPEERGRVQGINDLFVFGGVTAASLFSGGLMNCAGGGDAAAGWASVNLAMMPFLALAGGALLWLVLRPGEFRPGR